MSTRDSIGARLRAARQRLGLSIEQAAEQMRVTPASVSLMEIDDDEIGSCSLADISRFACVLQTTSRELFDIPKQVPPLKVNALEQLIREHCKSRQIAVQEFQEALDWPEGTGIAELPSVLIADICKAKGAFVRDVLKIRQPIA